MDEQLGGRFVTHNPLGWYLADPVTQEGGRNGFNARWMPTADIGLQDSLAYLDLIDRNRAGAVNVAGIDGGFAGAGDFGSDNPDFGPPFAALTQGDCDNPGCAGSAAGA